MTKRIDPDAKVSYGFRIKHGLRKEMEALFAASTAKHKSHFYEELLMIGIAKYKEDKNASST